MPITLFSGAEREPARMLEEGWLLYARPTALEPVGTLFRIDEARRRWPVCQVEVETRKGAEAGARLVQSIQTRIGFFARFLGLDSYGGRMNAERAETLEFEMIDPVRELADDLAMERAMAPVIADLKYRADNRYFVIRQTRSATAITYRISKTQLGELGGEASVAGAVGAGASLSAGRDGHFEIREDFPEPWHVMFMAEEILPVKAGLAGAQPVLGRMPVRPPLTWEE